MLTQKKPKLVFPAPLQHYDHDQVYKKLYEVIQKLDDTLTCTTRLFLATVLCYKDSNPQAVFRITV